MSVDTSVAHSSSASECIIGRKLSSKCHSLYYCKKIGFILIGSLLVPEKLLLSRRLEIDLQEDDQICLDHKAMYLEKYETTQKLCCNPFDKENHIVKSGLLKVDLAMSDDLNKVSEIRSKPGQKICPKCKAQYLSMVTTKADSSSDDFDNLDITDTINTSLTALGSSPLKIRRNVLVDKITTAVGVAAEDIGQSSLSAECKTHGKNGSKTEKGICAVPDAKVGKSLPEEVANKVRDSYEDDEFSRMCPGKKDCVSVRINGVKVQKQKRLLLCNLKELYVAYRNKYGTQLGFSKFCELRPKWCVTVGASGMHSVCVCTIHQNVKLMLQGANIKDDYKSLMEKMVCDLSAKECMLQRCQHCPGEEALAKYLEETFQEYDSEELIEFKQWVHTDRETLETCILTVDNFIEKLTNKIWKLTAHHFVSKHQTEYLKSLKKSLKETELIVLMDFAENYSFIVQDAAQGFHWENSQATVHPFVVYYINAEAKLQIVNFCIISDHMQHDTVAVHVFIQKMIEFLLTQTDITKIHYFSDGSAAQYKNYKNFVNLCNHKNDFNIEAEWNFFGTSHGKSPCDGVGGTTKRLAARASLQRPSADQILTPKDLFDFCDQNVHGIKYVYVPKEEIEESKKIQEERWKESSTIAGTRKHHQFIPVDLNSVCVSRISNDSINFVAKVSAAISSLKLPKLFPGCYVACIYDNKWWVGNIVEISLEQNDALVKFMHPHGPTVSFYWPEKQYVCWVPEQHFICVLPAPSVTSSGRQYQFAEAELKNVASKYKKM